MADINNFSDINENFNTIKTLLNSIRAQGILNTSDVDKILENINVKLEKINTEEDVDLIKTDLSDLKKNMEERHDVLISKFGAIESLFSNLLKNSNDTVKSEQLKELFDIIATNLSVFSREVVSQKETLTDITLRLDSMRSDDTQKKEIIKSISTVRNDIEKLGNGFDSIVISLNENFKTVLKTISEVDQSDAITGFSSQLTELINSSNMILSAIQLVDSKNNQFESSFEGLATHDDTTNIQRSILELSAKSQEISNLVDTLNQKSYKMDNLAEKIDASVNIVAGLKAEIADKDDVVKNAVLAELADLEKMLKEASSNKDFEEFKTSLEKVLSDLSGGSNELKESISSALRNISKLNEDLKSMDINTNFQNVSSNIARIGEDVKEKLSSEVDKLSQMLDINVTRTLNDISSNAEILNSRLKESGTLMTELCEKNFSEVTEGLTSLKDIVAQLDENNVSANNAIFSNITDRLAIFENSLKTSLEKQEDFVSSSSSNVFEQITNMKNVTEGIDYKLDSSAIELGSVKREFAELKDAVDAVLALDFVNVIKDIKVDLYAVKQELNDVIESSSSELAEKYTNDLFGKYELLVSKIDSVEDEMKYAQADVLNDLQTTISNISSSIVDILSYVSTAKEADNAELEAKLINIAKTVKDSNLNYVENVRDIVDVIRAQVESNLKQISEESDVRFSKITSAIAESNDSIKNDIRNSYDKILEVQENIGSINEVLGVNNTNLSTNIDNILASAESLKGDFDSKMNALKSSLLTLVTDFKNDFSCETTDKISELKFNSENLHSRAAQQSVDLKNELKSEIDGIIEGLRKNVAALNEHVTNTSLQIEGANKEVIGYIKNDFTQEVNNSVDLIKTNTADVLNEIDTKVYDVVNSFASLETAVNNLSSDTTTALSGTLAKILDNFVALRTLMTNIDEQSTERIYKNVEIIKGEYVQMRDKFDNLSSAVDRHLDNQISVIDSNYSAFESLINNLDSTTKENFRNAVVELKQDFDQLKKKLTDVDTAIDEDLARQISIIEGSFESINLMMVDVMNQATDSLGEKIHKELNGASTAMSAMLAVELEKYKSQIEDLFEDFKDSSNEQGDFIKGCALELNKVLETTLAQQNQDASLQLEEIGTRLKDVLDKNIELTSADYGDLKAKLADFLDRVEKHNIVLVDSMRTQIDDITKFLNSNLDIQSQEVNSCFEEISSGVQKAISTVREFNNEWAPKIAALQTSADELKSSVDEDSAKIIESLDGTIKLAAEGSTSSINNKVEEVRALLETSSNATQIRIGTKVNEILNELTAIQNSFNEQSSNLHHAFLNELKPEIVNLREKIDNILQEQSVNMMSKLNETSDKLSDSLSSGISNFILSVANLNDRLDKDELARMNVYQTQIDELNTTFNELVDEAKENVKAQLLAVSDELIQSSNDKFYEADQKLENHFQNVANHIDKLNTTFNGLLGEAKESINAQVSAVSDGLIQSSNERFDEAGQKLEYHVQNIGSQIDRLNTTFNGLSGEAKESIKTKLSEDSDELIQSSNERFDEAGQTFEIYAQNISNQIDELNTIFNEFVGGAKESIKAQLLEVSDRLIQNSNERFDEAGQTLEIYVQNIGNQIDSIKQNSILCKDLIAEILQEHFDAISKDIEKETDVIVGDILEQFSLLKDSQKDELTALTTTIEDSVAGYVIDAVNDLKSYMDVKTDSSILNGKLDTLRIELEKSVDETTENINKLLEVSVFTDAITDLRKTNEILLTNMADKLNSQIQSFVQENVTKNIEERINLLDKKLIDDIVDRYEEAKLIAGEHTKSFNNIYGSIEALTSKLVNSKAEINANLNNLIDGINKSVDELKEDFSDLKAQILNKSFDEAFHASVHNQISGIEKLINDQLGYIEDISELCCSNLPEISEMNAIVKFGIQKSISDLKEKVENQDVNISEELNGLKTDIITQFINVFNQISFVAEQEEIIDFIQEKHSELITILSHIVTTSDGIETVKDNVAVLDNKFDSLKEDIDLINEKITSIMSSEGDIDYVYSLQDLESDIANLRLVLNDMKADNKSKEFEELINSTNNIYQIVEAIKTELPKFEAEEFKKDFNDLAEDIVSISTRTNKLLLTSDESYKTLQDNLQDFRLVINDLDERTRNFAQDSGIDKLDNKLSAINTMIQNGAKTNQVFNQVFEYLAEWVDKAGEQITTISNKVDTLDDISQIKLMLEDLRAESQDNTESQELIDALTTIFDKQAKRIASLESKLDRIIVDSKINEKKNIVDIKPLEDTINKFLVTLEDKISSQHDKINLLENKLEEVVSLVDNKDTAQLTKKVGGMDRQLAKLNKSIEKIASNVVEK